MMIPSLPHLSRFLRSIAPLLVLSAALLLRGDWGAVPAAQACGGGYYEPLVAFRSLASFSSSYPYETEDLLGAGMAMNFEYPFTLQHGKRAQALLLGDDPAGRFNAVPSRAALDAAIAANDGARVRDEAKRIVAELMDRPAERAVQERDLLFEAARLAAPTQPQAVRDLKAALQLSVREIPNGYVHAIRTSVPPSTWTRLHQAVDDWLSTYPGHPLRDYAELWKVHLYYLSGETDAAWEILFKIGPKHPLRVAADMRFLSHDSEPALPLLQQPATALFASALVGRLSWSEARWNDLWRQAEAAHGQPWAVNLQERLLFEVAVAPQATPLPTSFPQEAKNHSQLWGKTRALVLMQRGRWKEAGYQLYRLEPGVSQAQLMVRYHLHNHRPDLAVRALQLDHSSRRYLLEVYLSEAQLVALTAHPREELRKDAQLALAARKLADEKWQEAADLLPAKFSEEKQQLNQAARLAKDRSSEGRLRFARFLGAHENQMLTLDTYWYRELSHANSQEPIVRAGIERQILATATGWHALKAYVAWLSHNPGHPDALQVLQEADKIYSHLDYYGGGNYYFWTPFLKKSPLITELRQVGKTIRSRKGTP